MTAISPSPFDSGPKRQLKSDVAVMLERTEDAIESIRALWPRFEAKVGVRGRKMYAMVDLASNDYATCTPVREPEDPATFGLEAGVLSGGWYLTGRLVGDPPALYERIGPAMSALRALAVEDPDRPLVEFYRRHDQVELWVPISD